MNGPIQKDDDHHSPIDCQKVQGLIDLLREIHAIFMMDQFGHINGILISGIFAMRLICRPVHKKCSKSIEYYAVDCR